jgi:hypothetical protein
MSDFSNETWIEPDPDFDPYKEKETMDDLLPVTLQHLWAIKIVSQLDEWLATDKSTITKAILVLIPEMSEEQVWNSDLSDLIPTLTTRSQEVGEKVNEINTAQAVPISDWLGRNNR